MGKTVGIDLGTTYSAIAVAADGGVPELLTNREGERITPSVVYFGQDSIVVGSMAKRGATRAPLDTAEFVKRQMGNPDWVFEPACGGSYRPEEVSAIILKRLKEDAEIHLGAGQVTDAVITVPAFFDDARRRATQDAGTIAGLRVRRVINEPTAAALAYGDHLGGTGTVLVYDLGGGTFDVTVMTIAGREFTVLGTDGLHELGGYEWDNRLMLWLESAFQEQGGGDLHEAFESEAELREKAEIAKRTLSVAPSTRVVLSHEGVTRTLPLSRETFEGITVDLLNQSRDLTISLVESLGLTFADIDDVLLVGGSTRMPMVAAMLEQITGSPPLRAGNPDELVALGAAIEASVVDAPDDVPGAVTPIVRDVTAHGLGTIALDDNAIPRNTVIIPRNTRVPAKSSEVFTTVADDQTEIRVEVTQGDDDDPAYVKTVTPGRGQIFAIPAYPAGAPVEIVFHYDIDQTIQVEVTDLTAYTTLGTFDVHNVANLTAADVAAAARKNKNLEVN